MPTTINNYMDDAAILGFENDLESFDDGELESEYERIQEIVDQETAWLEAIAAEQRRRARL